MMSYFADQVDFCDEYVIQGSNPIWSKVTWKIKCDSYKLLSCTFMQVRLKSLYGRMCDVTELNVLNLKYDSYTGVPNGDCL